MQTLCNLQQYVETNNAIYQAF